MVNLSICKINQYFRYLLTHRGSLAEWRFVREPRCCSPHAMSTQLATDAIWLEDILQNLCDMAATERSIHTNLRREEIRLACHRPPRAQCFEPRGHGCFDLRMQKYRARAHTSFHELGRDRDTIDDFSSLLVVLDSEAYCSSELRKPVRIPTIKRVRFLGA